MLDYAIITYFINSKHDMHFELLYFIAGLICIFMLLKIALSD